MRNNLIGLRNKKCYTQLEIASKLGIKERQYQNLEAGTSDGSIKVWQHLKELLKAKSIDYLLEQEETMQEDNSTKTSKKQ